MLHFCSSFILPVEEKIMDFLRYRSVMLRKMLPLSPATVWRSCE